MVFKSILGATCACLAVVSFSANAALVSRLGELAYYDTEADLTWLADANAAVGSVDQKKRREKSPAALVLPSYWRR